jgi:hypothetical protein
MFYSAYKTVNIPLDCHPCISSSPVLHPLSVSQTACNPRALSSSRCYRGNLCRVVLLFVTLPLDSVMESKLMCKSDSETKKSCTFMTSDEKIEMVDKLRGGTCAVAVGADTSFCSLSFRWYFTLLIIFQIILPIFRDLFINKYLYSTFISFCLLTVTLHGSFPASPLISYNIKFV